MAVVLQKVDWQRTIRKMTLNHRWIINTDSLILYDNQVIGDNCLRERYRSLSKYSKKYIWSDVINYAVQQKESVRTQKYVQVNQNSRNTWENMTVRLPTNTEKLKSAVSKWVWQLRKTKAASYIFSCNRLKCFVDKYEIEDWASWDFLS